MTFVDLVSLGAQAGWLAGTILKILFVLGGAGMSVVVWLLPRFFQVRWIVFAPIAGLAVITLVSLPLSLLGVPAGKYAPPLVIGLALISGGSVWLAFRKRGALSARRIALGHLRHGWVWISVGFLAVVLLSTKMLTYGGNGKADGAWGSSDFGAYWLVSDYLQHYGASVASYEGQTHYHASDLDDHIRLHARLGSMTTIAVLGRTIMPGRLAAILNPLIVASMWLLVALVQAFARRERLWPATALVVAAFHPFLYFLLFYSYHGQAFSVLLIAAGLLITEVGDRASNAQTCHRPPIAAGILFAASILQYPSAFVVPVIFLGVTLLLRFQRRDLRSVLICSATMLVVAGYHWPRSFRELAWISHLKVLPGWEWQRLANVNELLGLRSLLSYESLPTRDRTGTLVTLAISGLVALALFIHLRRGVLRRAAAAILIATGALATFAWLKYRQHIPNATHGLAKVISQYALFIVMFAAAGTVTAFPTSRQKAQWLVLSVMGIFALIQLMQVANWRRTPWFDSDLITLVERHDDRSLPVVFDPNLDDRLVAPLIKDYGRLASSDRPGPQLRFTLAAQQSNFPAGVVVDREGAYIALREK